MREEDKPFVCYKRGWSTKIAPRTPGGWLSFCLWMASYFAIVGGFLLLIPTMRQDSAQVAAGAVFLLVTAIWAFAMVRWMMARSEVVDLNELLEIKRDRDRKPRR